MVISKWLINTDLWQGCLGKSLSALLCNGWMSNDPEFRNILVGLEYFITDLSKASVILAWNFSCMCIALYKNQLQFVKKLSSFFLVFFWKRKRRKVKLGRNYSLLDCCQVAVIVFTVCIKRVSTILLSCCVIADQGWYVCMNFNWQLSGIRLFGKCESLCPLYDV